MNRAGKAWKKAECAALRKAYKDHGRRVAVERHAIKYGRAVKAIELQLWKMGLKAYSHKRPTTATLPYKEYSHSVEIPECVKPEPAVVNETRVQPGTRQKFTCVDGTTYELENSGPSVAMVLNDKPDGRPYTVTGEPRPGEMPHYLRRQAIAIAFTVGVLIGVCIGIVVTLQI